MVVPKANEISILKVEFFIYYILFLLGAHSQRMTPSYIESYNSETIKVYYY
jgi:hypothetical protein